MPVQDYNVDPDLNTTISGINIAEGCAPSGINDAIRQLMADVKEESEAQAEAVAGAESSASEQLTALDSTLRELIAQEVAKYLPRSGGEMTGALNFSGTDCLFRTTQDSYMLVSGGVGWGDAYLQLCGKNYGGVAYLASATIDGGRTLLAVKPGGAVEINDSPVLTAAGGLLMNGSNVVAGTFNDSGFTLPAGGTWAYSLARDEDTTNMGVAGIVAGGTTITTGRAGQHHYFAVRIA